MRLIGIDASTHVLAPVQDRAAVGAASLAGPALREGIAVALDIAEHLLDARGQLIDVRLEPRDLQVIDVLAEHQCKLLAGGPGSITASGLVIDLHIRAPRRGLSAPSGDLVTRASSTENARGASLHPALGSM